jgi:hypothetical protein
MAFMRPEYTDDQKWWVIDGTEGVLCFEEHAFTREEALINYIGTPFEVELISGFGVRLSAPGFLDCTDWVVLPTLKDCKAFVEEFWETDADSGDALMEAMG